MIRLLVAFACAMSLASAGCNKPTESKCKEAVDNILLLTGAAANPATAPDVHAWVRSCRSSASKDTVNCYIAAKTVEQLGQCEGELGKKLAEDEAKAAADAEKAKDAPAEGGDNP